MIFVVKKSTVLAVMHPFPWQRDWCQKKTPMRGLHWPLLGADALASHLGLAVVHTAVPHSDELEAGRNEMPLPTRVFIGNTAWGLDSKYWTSLCFKFVEQLLKLWRRNHHVIVILATGLYLNFVLTNIMSIILFLSSSTLPSQGYHSLSLSKYWQNT